MKNSKTIEEQIRAILDEEIDAISLSNQLFSPDGLFNQMATTEAERRKVAQSALFKQALTRLSHLQGKEGSNFSAAVRQAQKNLAAENCLLKFERA